jgi:hypothetical protein
MGISDTVREAIGLVIIVVGFGLGVSATVRILRADAQAPFVEFRHRSRAERADLLRKVRRDEVEPGDDLQTLRRQAELLVRQRRSAGWLVSLPFLAIGSAVQNPTTWRLWFSAASLLLVVAAIFAARRGARSGEEFLRHHSEGSSPGT